jgi:hypothetical protein
MLRLVRSVASYHSYAVLGRAARIKIGFSYIELMINGFSSSVPSHGNPIFLPNGFIWMTIPLSDRVHVTQLFKWWSDGTSSLHSLVTWVLLILPMHGPSISHSHRRSCLSRLEDRNMKQQMAAAQTKKTCQPKEYSIEAICGNYINQLLKISVFYSPNNSYSNERWGPVPWAPQSAALSLRGSSPRVPERHWTT